MPNGKGSTHKSKEATKRYYAHVDAKAAKNNAFGNTSLPSIGDVRSGVVAKEVNKSVEMTQKFVKDKEKEK